MTHVIDDSTTTATRDKDAIEQIQSAATGCLKPYNPRYFSAIVYKIKVNKNSICHPILT